MTKQVAECYAGKSYTVILKRTGTTIDIHFKSKDTEIRYKEEKVEMTKEETYATEE
jgi:hypothetical protein